MLLQKKKKEHFNFSFTHNVPITDTDSVNTSLNEYVLGYPNAGFIQMTQIVVKGRTSSFIGYRVRSVLNNTGKLKLFIRILNIMPENIKNNVINS